MVKKISVGLIVLICILTIVILPKALILIDLGQHLSQAKVLEGTIKTGDHLSFKHRIDTSEQVLQEVDVLYYNKKLFEVECHVKDKILVSIPTVYDGYMSMTPEQNRDLSLREKWLLLDYLISYTSREDDGIKIELNQEALDELSVDLTGYKFNESILRVTEEKMGSNFLNDKITFDVVFGKMLFGPSGDIQIDLTFDDLHIDAHYQQGQRLIYTERPMIKHTEIKEIMDRMSKLFK